MSEECWMTVQRRFTLFWLVPLGVEQQILGVQQPFDLSRMVPRSIRNGERVI